MMLLHLFPHRSLSMALRKNKEENYVEVPGYSEYELLKFVQNQNIKAWKVMLVWLSGNAVVGALYLFEILDSADLLMLTVFYFLCDYICILFFCPFQTWFMKNKCCGTCRIYNWDYAMMFTPFLFINHSYAKSLLALALLLLLIWEITYHCHPERFYDATNKSLSCANCKEKLCHHKKQLRQFARLRR